MLTEDTQEIEVVPGDTADEVANAIQALRNATVSLERAGYPHTAATVEELREAVEFLTSLGEPDGGF